MSDADKKKLTAAIVLLVIAGGLFAWFALGSGEGEGDQIQTEAAPVVQTKDGPPPAANRRLPPGSK